MRFGEWFVVLLCAFKIVNKALKDISHQYTTVLKGCALLETLDS